MAQHVTARPTVWLSYLTGTEPQVERGAVAMDVQPEFPQWPVSR